MKVKKRRMNRWSLVGTWVRSSSLFVGFFKQTFQIRKNPLFEVTTWAGWKETFTSDFKGGNPTGTYLDFSFARPVAKKPTFLRLRGLFEYEIQSRKYSIPLFFTTQGFETFRNREISTGAGAIREQLVDSDLRIMTVIGRMEGIRGGGVHWKWIGR